MAGEARSSASSSWIAEREVCLDGCLIANLSIRRPSEPVDGSKALIDIPDDGSVVFRWLNDGHLLVASRQRSGMRRGPEMFRGVAVHYDVYPNDPDRFHDPASSTIRGYGAAVDFRFVSPEPQSQDAPQGCEIDASFADAIRLKIFAGKHRPPVKSHPARPRIERGSKGADRAAVGGVPRAGSGRQAALVRGRRGLGARAGAVIVDASGPHEADLPSCSPRPSRSTRERARLMHGRIGRR